MKKLVFIALVLCSGVIGCKPKEPLIRKMGRRVAEPRFEGVAWAACCTEAAVPKKEACNGEISTRTQAIGIIVSRGNCGDYALAALESLASTNADVRSDVAAAYYLRYKRGGQDVDLLRSLHSLEGAPRTAAVVFNRALSQEALGQNVDALASWRDYLRLDRSPWSKEAEQHIAGLETLIAQSEGARWKTAQQQLPELLHRCDRKAIAAIVNEFPTSSQRYFEDDLLTSWANQKTPIENARCMAEELSRRLGGDRFDLDVVAVMERANGRQLEALRAGQFGYHDGLANPRDAKKAERGFAKAVRGFDAANSPLRIMAESWLTIRRTYEKTATAIAPLQKLAAEAQRHEYRHEAARIDGFLSYSYFYASMPVASIQALDRADAAYTRLNDREGSTNVELNGIGTLAKLGQLDEAFHIALNAVRSIDMIGDQKRRHAALGDTAETVTLLGYPAIALSYQNEEIRLLNLAIAKTLDETAIIDLRKQIGIALRGRAAIEAHLGRLTDATRDLDEAIRLRGANDPTAIAMQARIDEVRGQTQLRVKPAAAVEAFSHALALVSNTSYVSFQTTLYAQRAEARRLLGENGAAQADLERALESLRKEEHLALADRTNDTEILWTSYFERFQDTYRVLIRQFFTAGNIPEAFRYAERARGYEPLALVVSRRTAPASFLSLVPGGEPASLEAIQEKLPEGTFLFEYCVLDDETTVVWIISRDALRSTTLSIGRRLLDDYNTRAQTGDRGEFQTVLLAQYDRLIAGPLAIAGRMPGKPQRLVIIPDGPMHGLALAASLSNVPDRRYLFEKLPVEFAGSATLYLLSLLRDESMKPDLQPSVLLVGDPAFSDPSHERLPGARVEVKELKKTYGAAATIREDRDATIPEFLRLAKENTVIHVAAHGIVNRHAPSRSMLLFARSPNNSGQLDADELLKKLKLTHTRLIVLAACSSAGGLPVGPEGVAPLVRPLIAAGAPAVIGSLWPIPDATTKDLLVSFHQHYKDGMDAAEALQTAQIEMLNDKTRQWPARTWVAFQVIGHSSSPFAHATQKKEKPP